MVSLGPTFRPMESLQRIGPPPAPSLTLAEIVEEAVVWQPEAEAVIAQCVPPGGKTQVLARRGAQAATVYRVLREALAPLLEPAPPDGRTGELAREADQLLNHHHQLLQQALLLAFRPDSPARERIAAHCQGGLGDAGLRLRLLRWRVQATR